MKSLITTIFTALLLVSCVQKEHEKTIIFKVDMNGIENASKVGLRGNFTSPSWKKTLYLTDEDNDGVYTVAVNRKTVAYGVEFKFVNNENDYELKGNDNREIVFEYKPETIEYSAKFNNPQYKIVRK